MDRSKASGRFLLRMEPHLHAALREAARAAGVSLNEYCTVKLSAPAYSEVEPAGRVVKRALEVAGDAVVGVMVLGSWARGEARRDSDVDVLVVLRSGAEVNRELYRRWDADPLTWNGRAVDAHFVAIPTGDGVSGLWAEVALEGIVLFERDFVLSRVLLQIRRAIVEGRIVRRWSGGQPYWVAA